MPSRCSALSSSSLVAALVVISAVFLLLVTSCGKEEGRAEKTERAAEQTVETEDRLEKVPLPEKAEQPPIDNYIETGDLKAIKKRGTIRFVNLTGASEDMLPRAHIVTLRHFDLANKLAEKLKLEPVWLRARTPPEAIEMVRTGRADIVAYDLTDTEARRELIDFTIPIMDAQQILVTGRSGPDISSVQKLRDVELVVQPGSIFEDTAKRLIAENPDANLTIREVSDYIDKDKFLDLLNARKNRVAILYNYIAEDMRSYRDDIRMGGDVGEKEIVAWGMRKGSRNLLVRVDNFLTRNLVSEQEARTGDWKQIKKSGLIRLLTYNGPTSYFLWKGVLMGFDYDLAKAFADKHKLQLQVVVVPYNENLVDWLKAGRGDFAGASTTITEAREKEGVKFTVSYMETPEQVVSNKDKPPIAKVQDLAGRTLTLRAFSPFIDTARTIRDSGIDVDIQVAPPGISQSEIFNMISDGLLDASVADSDAVKIEASLQPNLITGTLLGDPKPQGWMVLPENRELLKRLNNFLKKYRKTKQYEKQFAAYFEPNRRFTQRVKARIIPGQDLSPFDSLVKNFSIDYDFDWRLVVAQMWQESNFNPNAVSPVGAQGLMQLMPATAEEMGFPPPVFEPDRNINAGVKYLDWVRSRFSPKLSAVNRLWFTLASYNAGYGHLLDAQRLAEELGLDPNVWFGNVEVAMLKLSEPQYFSKARYGYVRGAEPVQYVRNISNLYRAYAAVASGEISVRPPLRKNAREDIAESRGRSGGSAAKEKKNQIKEKKNQIPLIDSRKR
ncbi:MltF family protein [Microbulbifer thermotolerans]|uniref:Solute-binding protein family 3/N-terminal domain-containing protein n=1 Tax=Microbulbifer thermotolerans TaxID=252514 RepID=A0A143HL38_MICTH|nr:transporter substrate-binding domain-containing protein [Microbulbifer thermotolerans]AMX02190.1 hypothetical protein A3224_05975 [Microbulbifer thermotolerans]